MTLPKVKQNCMYTVDFFSPIGIHRGMTLGDSIRKHRKIKAFTQTQLADKLGVEQSLVSKWERCAVKPNTDSIQALSRALGVPVSELMGDNDPELSRFLSHPQEVRDAITALLEEDPAGLVRWLDVYQKASPERRRAILLALGESR